MELFLFCVSILIQTIFFQKPSFKRGAIRGGGGGRGLIELLRYFGAFFFNVIELQNTSRLLQILRAISQFCSVKISLFFFYHSIIH